MMVYPAWVVAVVVAALGFVDSVGAGAFAGSAAAAHIDPPKATTHAILAILIM